MYPTTLLFPPRLVGWLALFLVATTVSAQTLTLTEVEPVGGAPGDDIQLRGQGFEGPAASYYAWVRDGERGFILDVTEKSSQNQLSAVVADLADDIEGSVVLWQGRRSPVRPFKIGKGRFAVRNGFVFQPSRAADGPSFAATTAKTPGIAGRLVDGAIHLDLTPLASVGSEIPLHGDRRSDDIDHGTSDIETITVEISGESCGPPDGGSDGEGDGEGDGDDDDGYTVQGFGAGFRIECGLGPCRANPAVLIAAALRGVLEGSAVDVSKVGSTVVLSQSHRLCGAALSATLSPASTPVESPLS